MGNFYQNVANTVSSNRANAQNAAAFGNFLSTAISSWKQNKLDDIANQLLAQQNAPKAQAVTDANGNPIVDENMFSDTTAPDQSDEAAQNASLGYTSDPGQAPDAGGLEGLALSEKVAAQRGRTALEQARINKLNAPPLARPIDPLTEQVKAARLAKIKATTPGDDGLTPASRAVQARFDASMNKPPRPSADTYERFGNDLKAATGQDPAYFDQNRDRQHFDSDSAWVGDYTTPDQPGAVSQFFGAKPVASVPSKELTMPLATYQQFLDRRKALDSGHPTVLNQPAIDAAGTYSNRAAAPASTQDQATQIGLRVQRGEITREQARPLLQALGYQ